MIDIGVKAIFIGRTKTQKCTIDILFKNITNSEINILGVGIYIYFCIYA